MPKQKKAEIKENQYLQIEDLGEVPKEARFLIKKGKYWYFYQKHPSKIKNNFKVKVLIQKSHWLKELNSEVIYRINRFLITSEAGIKNKHIRNFGKPLCGNKTVSFGPYKKFKGSKKNVCKKCLKEYNFIPKVRWKKV